MTSQVTSGLLLNEMLAAYPSEPNAVLSSPFNRITAVRNHNTGLLGNENSHLSNTSSAQSQTDPSSLAQVGFDRMTLNDLLSMGANYEFPPTSNEFRVILFNDALKSGLFEFKSGVVHDAKAALLSGSSPSYKHLSSLAVSLAQSEKAFNDLKQKGLISEEVFRKVHSQLKNYAIMLSDIGNAYHAELIKRPGEDIHHAYLVVKSHKGGNFTKLCKRIANIDREVKSLLNSYPKVKAAVSQQMNGSVCQFINHYFQPEASANTENWREFGQYIKENAMDKITALFKNDARNRPGHLFDAGGSEHLYDCYSEIFDHFKTRQEVNQERHVPSPAPKADQPDDSAYTKPADPKVNSGNGINNNFSPVFNPINSPNFFNNINDSLLDKLDNNNRLLAEILEKLTSKQWSTQGTQTDSTAHHNEGTDPMPASLGQNVAMHTSISKPTVSNPKLIQTRLKPSDSVGSGSQTVLPRPASWTKLVDSIRHVTVTSIDTHPTIMPQMAKTSSGDEMNVKSVPPKRHVLNENELQKVKLRPTKTRDPMAFEVNRGYRERDYYEDNGNVSSGFVSDRRAAYEDTFLAPKADSARSVQAPASMSGLVADRRVTQEENILTPKSMRSNVTDNVMRAVSRTSTGSNELEKVRLKPTRTQDPLSFEVNQGYRDRDYYDGQGNVTPGFVSDRRVGFESDTLISLQDESAFLDDTQQIIPAKPVLTATRVQQQLDVDDHLSPKVETLTSVPIRESDLILQDASELTQIAAREIKRAEKVQNNHDFLAHLRSEKGIKVM